MKKFITIALAVAVLFSFAACQNQVPTYPVTKEVTSAGIEQVGNFIKGEKATADGFKAILYYSDGSTQEYDGNAQIITVSDDGATATASVKYIYDGTKATAESNPIAIEYKDVASVKVSGISNITVVEGTVKSDTIGEEYAMDVENPSLTFVFDGGEKTYSGSDLAKLGMRFSVYDGSEMLKDGESKYELGKTYTITLDAYSVGDGPLYPIANTSTGLTLTCVAEASPATVESIKALYTVTGTRYVNGVATPGQTVFEDVESLAGKTLYIGDNVSVKLVKVMSDKKDASFGEGETILSTGDFSFSGAVSGTNAVSSKGKTGTVSFFVDGKYISASVSMPAGNNTNVEGTLSLVQDTNVALGKGTLKSGTDITKYVTLSGLTDLDDDDETKPEFTVTLSPFDAEITDSSDEFNVIISFDSYGESISRVSTVDLLVVAAAE